MIKIAKPCGSRERERASVHLKNKCFVKNTLFGVVEKSEEIKKEEKANKIEEKERMDYNINILKGVFMLI